MEKAEKFRYIFEKILGRCGYNFDEKFKCLDCGYLLSHHEDPPNIWYDWNEVRKVEELVISRVGNSNYGVAIYDLRKTEFDEAAADLNYRWRQDIFSMTHMLTIEEVIDACIAAWKDNVRD